MSGTEPPRAGARPCRVQRKHITLLVLAFLYAAAVLTSTIRDFKIGFTMDDTLMFSSPAFARADQTIAFLNLERFSKAYWALVNGNIRCGHKKRIAMAIALAAKLLGIDAVIVTARPDINTDGIRAYWRWLTDEIYFTGDSLEKAEIIKRHRLLCFFSDRDSDIREAAEASVPAIRIIRSPDSSCKSDYELVGQLGEWVVPFSAY